MTDKFFLDYLPNNENVKMLREQFQIGSASHAYIVECTEPAILDDALKLVSAFAVCDKGGCLDCPACRRALKGVNCDVTYFPSDAVKKKITVADTDNLIEEAALKPLNSRNKAFLLNAVLSTGREEWQNKLLKTLEEPPANTYLFIAVSNAEALLQTVRSRCETVRIGGLNREIIEKTLLDAGVVKDTAEFAAGVSCGQIKKAFDIAARPEYRESAEFALDLLLGLKSSKKSAPFVSELIKRKEYCYVVFEMLELVFSDSVAASIGVETDLPESFRQKLLSIGGDFSKEAAAVCIGHIEYAKKRTDDGGNFTVIADELILKILEDKYRCRI